MPGFSFILITQQRSRRDHPQWSVYRLHFFWCLQRRSKWCSLSDFTLMVTRTSMGRFWMSFRSEVHGPMQANFLIIHQKLIPAIYLKVIEAHQMVQIKQVKYIRESWQLNWSRSTDCQYKIRHFVLMRTGRNAKSFFHFCWITNKLSYLKS